MNLDQFRTNLQNEHLSYSQAMQDVFALLINDFKINGSFLDIGSSSPFSMYSNSILLQLLNWKGICIDSIDHSIVWSKFPNSQFYNKNFLIKENVDFIISLLPPITDFLSFDIDDYTIDGLMLIDFSKIQFKCICIEHNKYLGQRGIQRFEQREILNKAGYKMVIKNFHNFEDWYINESLIDVNKFKYLNNYSEMILTSEFNIDEFSPKHKKFISNNIDKFNKETIQGLIR